jgi:hypothetical protein
MKINIKDKYKKGFDKLIMIRALEGEVISEEQAIDIVIQKGFTMLAAEMEAKIKEYTELRDANRGRINK